MTTAEALDPKAPRPVIQGAARPQNASTASLNRSYLETSSCGWRWPRRRWGVTVTPAVMVAVVAVVVMVGVKVEGLAERTSSSIYILLKMHTHTTAPQLARPKPTSSDSWASNITVAMKTPAHSTPNKKLHASCIYSRSSWCRRPGIWL